MINYEQRILNEINSLGYVCSIKNGRDYLEWYDQVQSLQKKDIIEPLSNYYPDDDNNDYYFVLKGNPDNINWIWSKDGKQAKLKGTT